MKVLVLGSTGFIGSAASAQLRAAGHRVLAVARPGAARPALPGQEWLAIDLARAMRPQDWRPHLAGVDAVLNCAGVFQDSPRDSTSGVHATGPAALYEACAAAGVRRVVHVSALGADAPLSAFSGSKGEGERRLMALDLDWIVLRPSVVLGRNAYGSGALFRGLAALPVLPIMPGTGPLQPVWVDDVTETMLRLLAPDAPARMTLAIVGPERLSVTDVARRYRAWLGWRPAHEVRLPAWLAAPAWRLGDAAGWLGWRPPVRSNARAEMTRGATGDPSAWIAAVGVRPVSLAQALAAGPATVQERWFARLWLLRPVLLAALALFWVGTGLVSLGPGWRHGLALLAGTPAEALAPVVVVAGVLADIAVGVGIALRRWCRAALRAGIAVTLGYAVAGTALRPELWADPLGAMLKIGPILALMAVALAILDER